MNKQQAPQISEDYEDFKREAINGQAKTQIFKTRLEDVSKEYKAMLNEKNDLHLHKQQRITKLVG